MNVIFLDMNGVLTTPKRFKIGKRTVVMSDFDDAAVQNLITIVKATNAKIVVTSTMRIYAKSELVRRFREWGILDSLIGFTPVVQWSLDRGDEIRQWLKENRRYVIDNFIIIDDGDDMCEFIDRLVQTNYRFGISLLDVSKAVDMLA